LRNGRANGALGRGQNPWFTDQIFQPDLAPARPFAVGACQDDLAAPPPLVHRKERSSARETGRVLDWMDDRAIPTENGTVTTLEVLHADYEVWCGSRELKAMTLEEFAETFDRMREMPEVAGNITKSGQQYYGIKLVDAKVAKLPVPKCRS